MHIIKSLRHLANNFFHDQDDYDLINQEFMRLNPTKKDIKKLIQETNDPDVIIWLYQYYIK